MRLRIAAGFFKRQSMVFSRLAPKIIKVQLQTLRSTASNFLGFPRDVTEKSSWLACRVVGPYSALHQFLCSGLELIVNFGRLSSCLIWHTHTHTARTLLLHRGSPMLSMSPVLGRLPMVQASDSMLAGSQKKTNRCCFIRKIICQLVLFVFEQNYGVNRTCTSVFLCRVFTCLYQPWIDSWTDGFHFPKTERRKPHFPTPFLFCSVFFVWLRFSFLEMAKVDSVNRFGWNPKCSRTWWGIV